MVSEESKTERLQVRVTPSLKRWVNRMVEEEHYKSQGKVVRLALENLQRVNRGEAWFIDAQNRDRVLVEGEGARALRAMSAEFENLDVDTLSMASTLVMVLYLQVMKDTEEEVREAVETIIANVVEGEPELT